MKQAIGYIRVSTDEQASDGVSLEAQRARIGAWCTTNDSELAAAYVDVQSAKHADNRAELQKALDHVCRVGGVLVVYSLSRLARNTKETLIIAERLDKAGADLASLTERIDTTTAAGKMVFRMLAVLAEFERDLIVERTTTAMRHKRSKGELVGKVPFGFTLAADGINLVRHEGEQRVLVLIAELHQAGQSLRQIAAELTQRGIPTKEGKAKWTHTAVSRIVSRQAA